VKVASEAVSRTWALLVGGPVGTASPEDRPAAGADCWDDWELYWSLYWDSIPCSYPDRTGDVRSVTKPLDFYSARQWHSTAMYSEFFRPMGMEHEMMLCLPAGYRRTIRLIFLRGSGPDFSERDHALLTLLRSHLHQAYLDAEHRRHPTPQLTPRQRERMHLVAAGHTNTQVARLLRLPTRGPAPISAEFWGSGGTTASFRSPVA
jgi:hypothetical protein